MSNTLRTFNNGLLIFFEGMDGTGKTTQLQCAADALTAQGWMVRTARSHGGSPFGEALRKVSLAAIRRPALSDMHVSLAMHAALLEEVMLWRQEGAIILVDRGPLSIVAYQCYADGADPKLVWPAVKADLAQFKPDATIIYDASVATAMERARHKSHGGSDYFESKGVSYFERVKAGFLAAAERFDCVVISSEAADIDQVAARTQATIHDVLNVESAQA
ncbi:dTMP kinase [Polaromonas sp.]|nr:dTMP kinase [Candidatus Saccharibacteria bacterium]